MYTVIEKYTVLTENFYVLDGYDEGADGDWFFVSIGNRIYAYVFCDFQFGIPRKMRSSRDLNAEQINRIANKAFIESVAHLANDPRSPWW